ncbi:ADP-heptose:LPS heptosyltransferase [Williamsia limnetica]|uniref:ADP-heptose:LPS heptosyltransferase n=1 Tax=Williamsia limnetica TaxID=882452 RepID=A0A318RM92_WILLI|nr:glycosyltransferase family 9 protein [Williamsia limnetica]PYE17445.1 ADP-heptose:LPS heptosyltransferase [Williamsia limnetica]
MAVTLVLRALGLGDLLTAVPALRALRAGRPDDRIVLAAPGSMAELAVWTGTVDDVIDTPGLGGIRWKGGSPDLAVNLHGSGPESIVDVLATGPARVLTHRHDKFPHLPGPVWDGSLHEVRRWCRLIEYGGFPTDPTDLALSVPDIDQGGGEIIIHPGAASAARRWPADRFATLAAHLRRHRHPVAITGNAAERELAQNIAENAGLPMSSITAGDLSLGQLAQRVANARLVICGDTGVAHLATAVNTPSVLLFGPTAPQRWGPPAGDRRHRVLWHGRTGDPHADHADPGLLEISVAEVIEAADSHLAIAHV